VPCQTLAKDASTFALRGCRIIRGDRVVALSGLGEMWNGKIGNITGVPPPAIGPLLSQGASRSTRYMDERPNGSDQGLEE